MVSKKTGTIQSILVICILIFIIFLMGYTGYSMTQLHVQETFVNPTVSSSLPVSSLADITDPEISTYSAKVYRNNDDIYDSYYAEVYPELIDKYKDKLLQYEIDDLDIYANLSEYKSKANILDLGCGTGTHLKELGQKYKVLGIDSSRSMLDKAKVNVKHLKNVRLIQGDFDHKDIINQKQFTHVICFYFSFYCSKNYQQLLRNVHSWLQRGGYFCVHLVDPHKFDPVLDAANPLQGIPLQKYMKKRKVDSKVIFNNFIYKSKFNYNRKNSNAIFQEDLIYPKTKTIRRHKHRLTMPSQNAVIEEARKIGFKLTHVTQLFQIGYEYQYICYLRKI